MLASVYVTAEAFGTQATLPCWGWSTTTSTSCVRRRLTLRAPSAKSSSESTLMAADRFTGRSRSLAAGTAGPSSTTALSAVTSSKPAAYSCVMTSLDRVVMPRTSGVGSPLPTLTGHMDGRHRRYVCIRPQYWQHKLWAAWPIKSPSVCDTTTPAAK